VNVSCGHWCCSSLLIGLDLHYIRFTSFIRSKSVWGWYLSTNIIFLDIILVLSLSKSTVLFIFQNNVSETGFGLRLQVKPIQLGPIGRASPYLRITVSAPRWNMQAKHRTNHLRELRKFKIIKTLHVWGLSIEKYQDRNHQWREAIHLMVPTKEQRIFPL
jgi:hypothetical protein